MNTTLLPLVRFVVRDENTFGYVDARQPSTLWILSSKPTRGATHGPLDGSVPLNSARPATRADFESFRVGIEQYERNGNDGGRYEIPTD